MYDAEPTVDDYIDQVAEQEAIDVLQGYGLAESDVEDAAWDVARVVAPRAMARILDRIADRGGDTVSVEYLRSLANSWANYERA